MPALQIIWFTFHISLRCALYPRGYSLIRALWGRAVIQGMVFGEFGLKQRIDFYHFFFSFNGVPLLPMS